MCRNLMFMLVLAVFKVQSVSAAQVVGGTLKGDLSIYAGVNDEYSQIQQGTWSEDWYALYNEHYQQGKGSWSLVPVKLTVELVDSKGAVLRSPLFPVLYFFQGKEFSPGPLRGTGFYGSDQPQTKEINLDAPITVAPQPLYCTAVDNVVVGTDQKVFVLGEVRYAFVCDLTKADKASVYLRQGATQQLLYQGGDSAWQTLWVGDLDRDGRLDFIDDLQFENGGCVRVWFSSMAKTGALAKIVPATACE